MKIGYLVSQYPAASHTFIRREIAELRLRGLDIQTFSVRKPHQIEVSSSLDQIEFDKTTYLLPPRLTTLFIAHLSALVCRPRTYFRVFFLALHHRVPGVHALLWAIFHFIEAIQLSRELELKNVSRLHNHFANSGATVGFLASQFLGIPWSLTLHGISETDYPAGVLLPEKIKSASFVACVSEFGRAQAMRISDPHCWNKMRLVRCAVDLRHLPIRTDRPTRDIINFICVARLSPEKGHLGLLQSFQDLLSRGVAAKLVLVGDGPDRRRIEKAILERNLTDHIQMTGTLNETATIERICAADALVLPSFMEGLPVVLMEAMAVGVPVIATRVAGIPELVIDGETGLLFTPSNWNELTEKLLLVCTDNILRRKLANAAREKIRLAHDTHSALDPLMVCFDITDDRKK